jgi:hypothetical protein
MSEREKKCERGFILFVADRIPIPAGPGERYGLEYTSIIQILDPIQL